MSKFKPNIPAEIKLFEYNNLNEIVMPAEGLVIYSNEDYGTNGTNGIINNNDVYTYSNNSWHALTKSRIVKENISGTVVLDLSEGNFFKLTLLNNVTSFDFINAVIGRQYIFEFIQHTTNKTLTWATGKYRFPLGNAPVLTDPTTNGSSPAKSVDIVTALCSIEDRLDIVFTPDLLEN